MGRARKVGVWSGLDPAVSAVSLPSRRVSPLQAVTSRALLASLLLIASTVIVYLGRDGYKDTAAPGQPLNLVASAYYSAVTLSTTGYGDIVPITTTARLVNTFVITPIRVIFLILLIGTTLEVLTERTRMSWRISRWRSKLSGHTVLVGYGTKGRSTLATLQEAGTAKEQLVVIDISAPAAAEANRANVVAVTGDGTRRETLASADIERAAQLIIAVDRDDTAVLIALTARQLNPDIAIIAAVREAENETLLRQCGAGQVVVSSAAAGRLLGLSTMDAGVGQFLSELLDRSRGLALNERLADPAEVGQPVRQAVPGAVAVLRAGQVIGVDDPLAAVLLAGDRIVLLAVRAPGPAWLERHAGPAPKPVSGRSTPRSGSRRPPRRPRMTARRRAARRRCRRSA
jgi:voltage-gated potassium channel